MDLKFNIEFSEDFDQLKLLCDFDKMNFSNNQLKMLEELYNKCNYDTLTFIISKFSSKDINNKTNDETNNVTNNVNNITNGVTKNITNGETNNITNNVTNNKANLEKTVKITEDIIPNVYVASWTGSECTRFKYGGSYKQFMGNCMKKDLLLINDHIKISFDFCPEILSINDLVILCLYRNKPSWGIFGIAEITSKLENNCEDIYFDIEKDTYVNNIHYYNAKVISVFNPPMYIHKLVKNCNIYNNRHQKLNWKKFLEEYVDDNYSIKKILTTEKIKLVKYLQSKCDF